MTHPIKAIIFDFDNTLEEWLPYEAEVDAIITEIIAKKYKLNSREVLKELNKIKNLHVHSLSKPEEFSRILWFVELYAKMRIPEDLHEINKLVDKYWNMINRKVKLFPTVKDTLLKLKGNHRLAIFSDSDGNKPIKLRRLKKLGIIEYFDHIFTSDDFGYNKPETADFKKMCKILGVGPREAMMVGDNPIKDLKGAKQIGMVTVWTQEGFRSHTPSKWADFTIHSMMELLELIDDMAGARK